MEKQLEPHQVRVVEELKDLENKVKALQTFNETNPIVQSLPEPEKIDLTQQLFTMENYAKILRRRVNRF